MRPNIEPLFHIHEAGEAVGSLGSGGPWFNWHGARCECDWINWTAPDGRLLHIGLIVPCPKCEYPFMLQVKPDLFMQGEDGQLTLAVRLVCPGYSNQLDDTGMQVVGADGRPMIKRCATDFVVREGLAHNPGCQCLHQPNCPAPRGGGCNCKASLYGQNEFCNCGARTGG